MGAKDNSLQLQPAVAVVAAACIVDRPFADVVRASYHSHPWVRRPGGLRHRACWLLVQRRLGQRLVAVVAGRLGQLGRVMRYRRGRLPEENRRRRLHHWRRLLWVLGR